MRLTGGSDRGRRLKGPGSLPIRPTSGGVREALFDILGARVRGSAFLDAFAGTGAVGIEALSRGALRVVFIESDRRAIRLIRSNLEAVPGTGSAEVLSGDAGRLIRDLAGRGERFQVAFLDPPYDRPPTARLLAAAAALLAPGGALLVEHSSRLPIAAPGEVSWDTVRTYRYGDTSLTLFAAAPAGRGR